VFICKVTKHLFNTILGKIKDRNSKYVILHMLYYILHIYITQPACVLFIKK